MNRKRKREEAFVYDRIESERKLSAIIQYTRKELKI